MDSPCSVNTENDYANLIGESVYDPSANQDFLQVPPIVYHNSPPLSPSSCFPGLDSTSLLSQSVLPSLAKPPRLHPHQGFSVRQVLLPKARVPPVGDSNHKGKGKGKEKPHHDTDQGAASSHSTNAPISPHICPTCPAEPVTSHNAALNMLASVTLARDDELALDVFNNGDDIDGCTQEQVKYFGLLSEIYRAADMIGWCASKLRTQQLSGTTPLAEVIMTSMLKKGYVDILEAATGGAYHHLHNQQIGKFLAPTASQLLNWIKPKEMSPVIPEMKPSTDQEVQWDPLLEMADNMTVFKEVGARLGMGCNNSGWEVFLTDASWAGLDKNYHNAVHATEDILQFLRDTPSTSTLATSVITWDIGPAAMDKVHIGPEQARNCRLHQLHCPLPLTLVPTAHFATYLPTPMPCPQGSEDLRGGDVMPI
ncbi:hypothetical protein M404DRAFT_23785 [Pisolithus tinctorius Marx 270]|uniref:Uncharacterized protein n=1 Tax=Pisolithus tinctorius Marx 270 TaxID=870435 RepID=A0A0C3PG45_PISTI|nr:hypothetical protein M404DRAFT_23785 [Pisolithus tinctorius Marx 270]